MNRWTKKELNELRSTYKLKTYREIAAFLDRTEKAVREMANLIGLRKIRGRSTNAIWKEHEIDDLRHFYSLPTMTALDIARKLKKTEKQVYKQAYKMKLRKVRS